MVADKMILRVIDWLALLCLFIAFMFAYGLDRIGNLEGRIAPVIEPAQLISWQAAPPPDYRTQWTASAEKLRECDFIRIEWYLGQRGGRRVSVVARFNDPPQIRTEGELKWDDLLVYLDPVAVLENSYADVLHKCPWRPWLVRSPFFTSPTGEN